MFVILVYDVAEERVTKALKVCRKYLFWVQNSVFEGEISEGNLYKLKSELRRSLDLEKDSVVIYNLRTTRYSSIEMLGVKKGGSETVI